MIRSEKERHYQSIHDRGSSRIRANGKRNIHERVQFLSGTEEWERYVEKEVVKLKEIQEYKDLAEECLVLRYLCGKVFTILSAKGIIPSKKTRIKLALEQLGEVKVG